MGTISINTLKTLAPEKIKEMEGRCTVLVNGKITPELGLKVAEFLNEKKKPLGEFIRFLVKNFVDNGIQTKRSSEPAEYFIVLSKIFAEIFKSTTGKKEIMKAMKKIGITPKEMTELKKEVE